MTVDRRSMLALAGATVAGAGLAPGLLPASAQPASPPVASQRQGAPGVQAAIDRLATLPVTAGCLVAADHPARPWRAAHNAAESLYVGSVIKTFILAQYLRDVEAGRLTLDQMMTVDDSVRSLSSPVFLHLTGRTPARSVLEAMIAHSDNTATDIALAAAGVAPTRALIAEAGMTGTRIPDSTRRVFSYLAGAPVGTDLGWEGISRAVESGGGLQPRDPLNDQQVMMSSADDLVAWYRAALAGRYFTKPETLVEFKRIQATATALALTVPANTAAYGKGGSIDWGQFHCVALAGQMVSNRVPVTFSFTINWRGPDDGIGPMMQRYGAAVSDVLQEAAKAVA